MSKIEDQVTDENEGYEAFRTDNSDKSPAVYIDRLISTCPEFAHLEGVRFAVIGKYGMTKAERVVLGDVSLPKVQGTLSSLFDHLLVSALGFEPDFLIRINLLFWNGADPKEREVLIYHELCHVEQKTDADGELMFDDETGIAKCALVAHDLDEFHAVARRHGAWSTDIQAFTQALQDHDDAVSYG